MDWYEAYAFCIWDGGFLPSEAEWEYAAAGGSQQREYPWGSVAPGTASLYAIYDGYYPSGSAASAISVSNIAPVGTATKGAGAWGQLDLAGSVWEWVLDYSAGYGSPCTDCADLTSSNSRVDRGGGFCERPVGLDAAIQIQPVAHGPQPQHRGPMRPHSRSVIAVS